jgi:hypothetical protein
MAIDFNDLIPTATKEKPEKNSLADLYYRQAVPKGGAMDFEDLVPRDVRFAFPRATPEQLELAHRALTTEPPSEETTPLVDIGSISVRQPTLEEMLGQMQQAHTPQTPLVGPPSPWTPVGTPRFLSPKKVLSREVPTTPPGADPNKPQAKSAKKQKPIGFRESVKEELTRPSKGAQYVPMVGGVIGTTENLLYLDAANRLSEDYDYSKPLHPERLMPGALGRLPASYTTREKDIKLIEDLLLRTQKQQERGYSFGGKVAKGVLVLPTWMIEFALTGGLAKLGSKAAQEAGEKLLKDYAKTRAGHLALRTAGWTGGAITRTTLGLLPRVTEKAAERQVGVQILGLEPESWATSVAKGWGGVFVEAASEEAGETLTKGAKWLATGALNRMPFGRKFLVGLSNAWAKLSPDNTAVKFWKNIFSKGGYSNIIGEIGEERLATLMHSIAKTEDYGAGKDANIIQRLQAGINQDIKNFPVEATVLSIPGAVRFSLSKATGVLTTQQPQAPEDVSAPMEVDYAIVAKDKGNLKAQIHRRHKNNPKVLEFLERIDALETIDRGKLRERSRSYRRFENSAVRQINKRGHYLQLDDAMPEIKNEAYILALTRLRSPDAEKVIKNAEKQAELYDDLPEAQFIYNAQGPARNALNAFLTDEAFKGISHQRVEMRSKKAQENLRAQEKARFLMSPMPEPLAKQKGEPAEHFEPYGKVSEIAGEEKGPFAKKYVGGKKFQGQLSGKKRWPIMFDVIEELTTQRLIGKHSPLSQAQISEINVAINEANEKRIDVFSHLYNKFPQLRTSLATAWEKSRAQAHYEAGEESKFKSWPSWKEEVDRLITFGKEKPILNIVGNVPDVDVEEVSMMNSSPFYSRRTELVYSKESYEPTENEIRNDLGDKLYERAKDKNFSFAAAERVYPLEGRIRIETYTDGHDRGWTLSHARGHIGLRYVREASPRLYRKIQKWYAGRSKKGRTQRPLKELFARQYALEAKGIKTLLPRDVVEAINKLTEEDIPQDIYQRMIDNWDSDDFSIQKKPEPAEEEKETTEKGEHVPLKKKMSFEDLIPRPDEAKHIQNVVIDQFRDWPEGIKKVGKDYWVEVMAAAKALQAPFRYKALRRTLLGVFRHKQKPTPEVVGIELQDVTDALTATHELGHDLDWLLNNKTFPSSISKRFPTTDKPDTYIGEFTLRKELQKVSKVLRPDLWKNPKAYIKSHPELMADFISLYILDPEKTRELAPNLTPVFEQKLSDQRQLFLPLKDN